MSEPRAVVVPHSKENQHLKIVLRPDGTLEKVQIYSDAQGNREEILAVYEELKQEIVDFTNKTTKLIAVHDHEKKKKEKSWWGSKK